MKDNLLLLAYIKEILIELKLLGFEKDDVIFLCFLGIMLFVFYKIFEGMKS